MASTSVEVPSHRACAHCRSQKVRCITDEEDSKACQRCARSGRQCLFTPLQKRKQRKRTDTRVAELEREMRNMRAMLKNKEQALAASAENNAKDGGSNLRPARVCFKENKPEDPNINRQINQSDQQSEGAPYLWPTRLGDSLQRSRSSRDVVDCGILSMVTARQLFEIYKNDVSPHFPIVPIPSSTTADEMRETMPMLFLSVISAASRKEDMELSTRLDQEMLQAYATKCIVGSEKSLELVQALLISAVWYNPPAKFGQLKYYDFIHMAATMALDIGIATRPSANHYAPLYKPGACESEQPKNGSVHSREGSHHSKLSVASRSGYSTPDTADLASRRTLVSCYAICTTVAMSLRRPNMVRVSNYIKECVEYLEHSPDAIASDRRLAAWVRLIMIAEEIAISFSYDDPERMASIAELRTQLMLRDFENRLTKWFDGVLDEDMNGCLTIIYNTIRLYLHEIALHVEHSPEDFRAPYRMGGVRQWEGSDIPSEVLGGAIAECIECSYNLFNAFLAMDVESLRTMPIFVWVRVSFGAFVLAKLYLSASHKSSRIREVLDQGSLRVEKLLDRAIIHVRNVVGAGKCRVPAIFFTLLFKLRAWCMNPELIISGGDDENPEAISSHESDGKGGCVTKGMEVSRGTELSTGSEQSSLSTPEGRSAGTYDGFEGAMAYNVPIGLAATSVSRCPQPPSSIDHNSLIGDSAPMADMISATSSFEPVISGAQIQPHLTPTDQANLDQNFLPHFGGWPVEGGLTGLDDWADMPTDIMSFAENFNWLEMPGVDGDGVTF